MSAGNVLTCGVRKGAMSEEQNVSVVHGAKEPAQVRKEKEWVRQVLTMSGGPLPAYRKKMFTSSRATR